MTWHLCILPSIYIEIKVKTLTTNYQWFTNILYVKFNIFKYYMCTNEKKQLSVSMHNSTINTHCSLQSVGSQCQNTLKLLLN